MVSKKPVAYKVIPVYETFESLSSDVEQARCIGSGELIDCFVDGGDYLSPDIFKSIKNGKLQQYQREITDLCVRIRTYEAFIHDINMYAAIIMSHEGVQQLIDNACRWSYAHRSGNGELSEEEQDKRVYEAFLKLREVALKK